MPSRAGNGGESGTRVIAVGAADTTDPIGTGNFTLLALLAPADTEGANFLFLGATERGGTYSLIQQGGADIAVAFATGKWVSPTRDQLAAIMVFPWIKVRTSANQSGADATISFVMKSEE